MDPWTLIDKLMFAAMRWLADKSADVLIKLKVSQNQVTFYGSMIFLPLSAIAFSLGTYQGVLLGILFAFLHSYFDFIDGFLGRKTNTLNKLGKWSDPAFDAVGSGLIMAGVGIGVLRNFHSLSWLVIVMLAFFGHYASLSLSYHYEGRVYGKNGLEILKLFKRSKTGFGDWLIKEFIFLRSFVFIFFGTLRYSLIVFSALNRLHWFILIWAVFTNLRWMIMFFAFAEALNQPGTKIPQSNLKIVKILRRFILSSV